MGRIGITSQDVINAISKLQGQQKHPTVDHIREVLGTGSKSTIARFLREWKARHSLQNDDDGRLPGDLLGMVKGLWDRLQEKAVNQATAYQQESDAKITQIQLQLNQHKQLQTDLQLKIHGLEEQLHQQTEENQQLKIALATEQQEKIIRVERAAALEFRRQESQAENERLHQLLKHVQENLEHYQAATQQLRQEQSLLLEKQRSEYEQKLSQLQRQMEAITNEKSLYQAQYTQLNKAHEALEAEHKTLAVQHKETQKQYESAITAQDHRQQEYVQLSRQNQEQSQGLEAKRLAVMELQLKLKADSDKIALLEDTLSKANDKINSLRHGHQFISHEKARLEGQVQQLQAILSANKTTKVLAVS